MHAFITWNLYDYEFVREPPERLPDGFRIYITDSQENKELAWSMGWDAVIRFKGFENIKDKAQRRKVLPHIICYPEKVVNLDAFDSVFMFDSNVMVMPLNYSEFVNEALESQKAFYCSSGVYSGWRDTIEVELGASHSNERWSYGFDAMDKSVGEYLEYLKPLDLNPSVVFAKYIGWNLKHPMKNQIADYVFNEEQKHLQGNIILTMASVLFKDHVFNSKLEYMNNNWMAHIINHRYEA
jgi:hypothetical protein